MLQILIGALLQQQASSSRHIRNSAKSLNRIFLTEFFTIHPIHNIVYFLQICFLYSSNGFDRTLFRNVKTFNHQSFTSLTFKEFFKNIALIAFFVSERPTTLNWAFLEQYLENFLRNCHSSLNFLFLAKFVWQLFLA